MGPESRTQHVGLAAAAAIACHQLLPYQRSYYDIEHFNDLLTLAAYALARLAPIYVTGDDGARRALSDSEQNGALIQRGATVVLLADGRAFTQASVQRGDLRDAIAILKSTGWKGAARSADGTVHPAPEGNEKVGD
jgi:hypothetical protein